MVMRGIKCMIWTISKENKFRYETVRLIEDIVFNINYCNDIDSMNLLNIVPYHYAKRMTGSLTTKFVPDYYQLHRRRIEMLLNQQRYWRVDTASTLRYSWRTVWKIYSFSLRKKLRSSVRNELKRPKAILQGSIPGSVVSAAASKSRSEGQ